MGYFKFLRKLIQHNIIQFSIVKHNKWGIKINITIDCNCSAVSHIMYADDLLIMGRANKVDASVIKVCFDIYCDWTWQKANLDKSFIILSRNTRAQERRIIKELMGFKEMSNDSVYLGNTFVMGINKTKEFQRLKNRIKARLEGWNGQLLQLKRRAALLM